MARAALALLSTALVMLLGVACARQPGAAGAPADAAPERVEVRPAGPRLFHRVAGNLVQNSGFEQNWFNREFAANRRFLLLQSSDLGVGEGDGHLDYWQVQGPPAVEAWDTSIRHGGDRSLRLPANSSAAQRVRFAGEQATKAGGSSYAEYLPLDAGLAAQLPHRPIVAGAWCRTRGVPEGKEPRLTIVAQCATRSGAALNAAVTKSERSASVTFSSGDHEWEYREVRLDPATLPGTPFFVVVMVNSGGGGTSWFDDVSCVEPASAEEKNLAPNPSFEEGTGTNVTGWSAPELWPWFRNDYYLFTSWTHEGEKSVRGGVVRDAVLAFSGRHSLRFTVFPGDNFAVHTEPIPLNQTSPHPLEARLMVKADELRTLEVMAQDETGEWLPQGDFLGDDMENNPGLYNMGTTGSGTYDWFCVRKYFTPRKPVKSLRLFLCVRGFDGVLVPRNRVGTLWADDVQLFEHTGAAGGSTPRPAAAPATGTRVTDIDLGDRLWGRNAFTVRWQSDTPAAARAELRLRVTDPHGATRTYLGGTREVPGERASGQLVSTAGYRIETLCRDAKEQYRLSAELIPPAPAPPIPLGSFAFGTPSAAVTAGQTAHFVYPGETQTAWAQVNVARDSLPDIDHAEVRISAEGKPLPPRPEWRIGAETLAALHQPRTGPQFVDTHRLLTVPVTTDGLPVHSWKEPTEDLEIGFQLSLRTKPAEPSLAAAPVRFGVIERLPPPELPETVQRTAVNERGYITVNGTPYYPVYWTPQFGMLPEANYPPGVKKLKTVDLTSIVYSANHAPDEGVRQKLLARIAEVRQDPQLFQYALGEGEMQLQGADAIRHIPWLKSAIRWIREADPNHLINGPESWLVGHPGHDAAMRLFVPDWDVIGVETSFEEQPHIREHAGPLMKEKRTAVLVGLEAYYFQTPELLRWRGYQSLLHGAAGVGLCPSGMLQARPDRVNYLRGLNGEFRGLAPVFMAPEPRDHFTTDTPAIQSFERVLGERRYLFAMRDGKAGPPAAVRFRFPAGFSAGAVRVLCEGRTLRPEAGGFTDRFDDGKTVHAYELTREAR